MRAPLMVTVCLLAVACSRGPSNSATSPLTSAGQTPTSSVVGPVAPTPGPVPAQLQGTWHQVGTREKMVLSSVGFRFFIRPDSFASGQATVDGSKILFSGSLDCPGDGLYLWSLTGGTLHFTAANVDLCPRSGNLNGKDWILVHH